MSDLLSFLGSLLVIERLALRQRPPGLPIMVQIWAKLLFLHWPVPVETLRPLIPEGLEIDTFDGSGWASVTPLTIRGVRPPFTPPLPLLSQSHELNVRTYVHRNGVSGVWFFSLENNNPLAVFGARHGFYLPYWNARISLKELDQTRHFQSHRTERRAPPADFEAIWTLGEPLPYARPGTLEFFLIERYCLYTTRRGKLYRGRIHHEPWPLRQADVVRLHSNVLEANGLPAPTQPPLVQSQADSLKVEVWPLERVA